MSDPIRTALEAAAKTYCHLEVKCTCKGPERCFNSAIPKAKTAEAIAAFLRALPDQYTQGGAAFWDAIPTHDETRLWLADAVLAAAKDQTND
jgi:hypothetical protein